MRGQVGAVEGAPVQGASWAAPGGHIAALGVRARYALHIADSPLGGAAGALCPAPPPGHSAPRPRAPSRLPRGLEEPTCWESADSASCCGQWLGAARSPRPSCRSRRLCCPPVCPHCYSFSLVSVFFLFFFFLQVVLSHFFSKQFRNFLYLIYPFFSNVLCLGFHYFSYKSH